MICSCVSIYKCFQKQKKKNEVLRYFFSYFESDVFSLEFMLWSFINIYALKFHQYLCHEASRYYVFECRTSACCCFVVWYFCFFINVYFRPLAPMYNMFHIIYFLRTERSQRNQCSKWPFHFCATIMLFCIYHVFLILRINQVYITCGFIHTCKCVIHVNFVLVLCSSFLKQMTRLIICDIHVYVFMLTGPNI